MRKNLKKILCILLVVIMCLTSAPLSSFVRIDFKVMAAGDIIEFGSYPQSEVKDEALIAELNALAPSWDDWISYDYYSGDGNYGSMVQGDWMRYIDRELDFDKNGVKEKYRGVKFTQYRPYSSYDTSSSSTHKNNGFELNKTYWFKFESIKWKILDTSTGLVVSEKAIDSQAFSDLAFQKGSKIYNDAEYNNYISDYNTSSIRSWLNNTFYLTSFSPAEREKIIKSDDFVTLLSRSDICNSKYGFSSSYSSYDSARIAKCSDYAKIQGCGVYSGNAVHWYLKTADGTNAVRVVANNGYANYTGVGPEYNDVGIRPTIYLKNAKKVVADGYNILEDSYKFTNQQDRKISRDKFIKVCGVLSGSIYHWAVGQNTNGLCFGMAYTTANFWKKNPSTTNFGKSNIRLLDKSDLGVGFFEEITLLDYIEYAQVAQANSLAVSGIENVVKAVENYVKTGNSPVIINLSGSGSHAVLAIGIDDEGILIDDPGIVEEKNDEIKIKYSNDGYWKYSNTYNSENGSKISYTIVNDYLYNDVLKGTEDSKNNYKGKIVASEGNIKFSNDSIENLEEILFSFGLDSNQNNRKIYRLEDLNAITLENIDNKNARIIMSNSNIGVSVDMPINSKALIHDSIEEYNEFLVNVSGVKNNELEIDFFAEKDEKIIEVKIIGVAATDEVTGKVDESEIKLNGFKLANIEILEDNCLVERKNIGHTKNEITLKYNESIGNISDIIYEAEEHKYNEIINDATCVNNGSITLSCSCGDIYTEVIPSTGHTFSNGNSKCSNCDFDRADSCDCKCHKTGIISKIIWFITNFFNKLLKKNQVCDCGKVHFNIY